MIQTITRETYRRRIRTYARKLAEIEHFIEQLDKRPPESTGLNIVIHKYWQNQ